MLSQKRQIIEDDFNYMLKFISPELEGTIEIINLEPIGIEIPMDTLLNNIDKDSLADIAYERLGIEKPQLVKSEDILTTINSASPLVANKILDSLTTNEIRSIISLIPLVGGDVIKNTPAQFNFKDEDINSILINKFKAIGVNESDYEIVSEHENIPYEFAEQTLNEKVIEILKENEKIKRKGYCRIIRYIRK